MRLLILATIGLILTSCNADPIKLTDNVNPIIGNAGKTTYFAEAEHVSEESLVQSHLRYAEELLRSLDVAHLSASQIEKRSQALDLLRDYWQAGVFPGNFDYPDERRPCFIDQEGRICAVGYLIEQTAGREAAEKINKDYQYAFIDEMPEELLSEWMNEFGFSKKEIATIQPAYDFIKFHQNDGGIYVSWDSPLFVEAKDLSNEMSLADRSSYTYGLAYNRSLRRFRIHASLLNSRKAFAIDHSIIGPHSESLTTTQDVVLNYIEVPIAIGYNKHLWRGLTFHADAGIVSSFLTNSDETTEFADGSKESTDVLTSGVSDFLFSTQISAGITGKVTNRLACSILPYFRYTSKSIQPDYLADKLSTIGLGGVLYYHF